ncbi:MAG: hypothetical protein AB7F96_04375 [Beijerinckiaceae bacterium]
MSSIRPKFLPSFIALLSKESESSGYKALVPFALIFCVVFGLASAWLIPDAFWKDEKWDVSTAVYAGLMTFGGLVLALGWNAFSRIYEVLFRGDFGAYLQEKDLLNAYLVHITFMHIVQVAAIFVSGFGLVTILLPMLPMWADRTVFGLSVGLTAYALVQAMSAVTAMNDLVWQSAIFERAMKETKSSNVTPLPSRGGNDR